jgi:hypothetical protein
MASEPRDISKHPKAGDRIGRRQVESVRVEDGKRVRVVWVESAGEWGDVALSTWTQWARKQGYVYGR